MQKVIRFLELMWAFIAIICFIVASYHLLYKSIDDALFFYFFSAMAVVLYFLRKRQRKNIQKNTPNH